MSLSFLIYISVATSEPSDSELSQILQVSRTNNERDNITGMLLYKERRFMQLLEGPGAVVRATYDRIAGDPRHHEITMLVEGELEERDFPDWSMGFQTLDNENVRALPGYSDFLDLKFSVFQFADDPSRAHQLLRVFRRL